MKLNNANIQEITPLISPQELREEMPVSSSTEKLVLESRKIIQNMLEGKDNRLLFIVGPCSIHDPNAALDYAQRLVKLRDRYKDKLVIIMRVYFEKPRTTIGWKGLINDPDMDGNCNVVKGLKLGRQLLLKVGELDLPAATEVLDPISPQYLSDLISWASIGARTTESQTHREMASGLSMPVGFKNSTDGSVDVALGAMQSAKHPHAFIGINQDGHTCVVRTTGNPYGHVILRGGHHSPNYHPESIESVTSSLKKHNLCPKVMVDCSHANSGKKHVNQEQVLKSVIKQVKEGNNDILGVMIESNLHEGNQSIPKDLADLKYGVSITDECIGWEQTEALIRYCAESL
jgi:3-deoxy-7-phosphoheptulonate synthase